MTSATRSLRYISAAMSLIAVCAAGMVLTLMPRATLPVSSSGAVATTPVEASRHGPVVGTRVLAALVDEDERGAEVGQVEVLVFVEGQPTFVRLRGKAPGDSFGHAVASTIDLDVDGHIDIVVGAPTEASGRGRVYVFYGPFPGHGEIISAFDADFEMQSPLPSGYEFGDAVAPISDQNGDGVPDLRIRQMYINDDHVESHRTFIIDVASGELIDYSVGQESMQLWRELSGDHDRDGDVDADDALFLTTRLELAGFFLTQSHGDLTGDRIIDGVDFLDAMWLALRSDLFDSTVSVGPNSGESLDVPGSSATDDEGEPEVMYSMTDLGDGFENSLVLGGLGIPMSLQFLPDGRLLILEKAGKIRITDPGAVNPVATEYMILPDVVTTGEKGLIDIALDPEFEVNNFFYLYYISSQTNRIRISRFVHHDDHAHPAEEVVLWEDPHDATGPNHYGGGLSVGPDGKLYLTIGDKWDDPAESQDLGRAGGKIIRINRDGTTPSDNPFADGAGGNLDEIWAIGLRNPFRSTWDLPTDRFFIGDVGGNVQSTAQEEVNLGIAGANYGWPHVEGVSGNPAFTNPVFVYDHTGVTPNGGAVVGGCVYRGDVFPSEYYGAYFFGDYAQGWIRFLAFDESGSVIDADPNTLELDAFCFEEEAGAPVAIEQGSDGALYYLDIVSRELRRIRFQAGNESPEITFANADVTSSPTAPLTVTFDGAAIDPDGDPLSYLWVFGDGGEAPGETVVHTYEARGEYIARLIVSDGTSSTLSDPIRIVIGNPPSVSILSPTDNALFIGGDEILMLGDASDDGPLFHDDFSWTVRFIHNAHTHPVLSDVLGPSTSLFIEPSGHDYSDETGYEIELTVTDADGISASETVRVFPDKVDIFFRSDAPGGVTFVLDGLSRFGEFVHDTLKNFEHVISVPERIFIDGRGYSFIGWSDGHPDATRIFLVPEIDFTLTAMYAPSGPDLVFPGLVGRFDADTGVSIALGIATNWADQSGFGNHLVSGGDPRLIVDGLNGHDTIRFDGMGDKLERTESLNGFPGGNADRTMIYLTKYDSVGYGGLAYGTNGGNQAFGLIVDGGGDLMVQGWGGSSDLGSGVAGTGEEWLIQSVILEASQMSHYRNGQLIDSRAHTYNTSLTKLMLGAEIDGSPFLNMEVAEVLIYDRALSPTEHDQVIEHLSAKYFDTPNVNDAPVLVASGDVSVRESRMGVVELSAHDIEGDGLSFSTTNLPAFAALTDHGDGTATLTVSPPSGSAGVYDDVIFTVTDDGTPPESDSEVITITINSADESTPVVDGLVLELDSAGMIASGDLITGWSDQSGFNNHLVSAGDPRLIAGGLNGRDTIRFDGVGDKLERTASLNGLPEGNADRTMIYLTKYDSVGYGGLAYGAKGGNLTFGLIVDGSGELMVQGWGNDFASGVAGTGEGWLIQSVVLDNGQMSHYRDGELIDSRTHTYNTALSSLMLGAEIDGSPFLNMEVAEVLIYDQALTAAEHHQVIEYLGLKYFDTPNVNDAPVLSELGNLVMVEGQELNVDVTASDIEDDELTISATNLPSFAMLTDHADGTATLSLSPPSGTAGVYEDVTIQVTDDGTPPESDSETISITILSEGGGAPVMGGLVLALDGRSALTSGDDVVTSWVDQSGTGNHLSGGGDPRLITGGLNGSNTILFDGAGDKLERTSELTGLPSGSANRTMVYLTRYDSVGYGGLAYGTTGGNQVFGLVVDSSGELMVQGWGSNNDFASGDAGTGEGWLIHSAIVEDGHLSHFRDGELIDSRTHMFNTTSSTLMLGAEIDGNPFLEMEVAEVLIYDRALTATEHLHVTEYLLEKYFNFVPLNDPPVLAAIGDIVISEGQELNVDVTASDIEGDELTFLATNLPSFAVLTDHGDGTARLMLNPSQGSAGIYEDVTITVTDDGSPPQSDAEAITITVNSASGGPPVVDGLVLELNASGVVALGDLVTGWSDQSGMGNHLSSGGDPRLITGGLNSHDTIRFDGVGDKLERTSDLNGLPSGSANRTMVYVTKYNSNGYGGLAYGTNSGNKAFGLIVDSSGRLMVQGWGGSNDAGSGVTGTGAGWLIQSVVVENDQMSHYLNGEVIDSRMRTYNTALTRLMLGAEIDGSPFLDMEVAEVLIYDRALSGPEHDDVIGYLSTKFGITAE